MVAVLKQIVTSFPDLDALGKAIQLKGYMSDFIEVIPSVSTSEFSIVERERVVFSHVRVA